jgi:peptidoglycan/LPS O-acetylase OafA/YrhL
MELIRGGLRDLANRPQGNEPLLDVLRSLAIMLVFSTHFAGIFNASARVLNNPFVYYGWSGVDLFFVLSGFLIGCQLWKEVRKSGQIRVGTFLLRRGLRIWPLYFSFILLVLIEALSSRANGAGLVVDATFISNYFHGQVGGSWSLSTEEQFYILAPVSIALLARKLKVRDLWVAPAAGLLIPIVARELVARSSPLAFRDLQQELYYPIHTHSDGLAIGLFIAWLTIIHPDFLRTTGRRLRFAGVMVVAAAALYVANRIVFDFTTLALIFGAATCFGAVTLTGTPWIFRWNGFYIMSRLSYGIYLNHFEVLPRLYPIFGKWRAAGGETAYWVCYATSLLICIVLAAVTFCLIAHPFLVLRSHWLKKMRDRDAAIAR